MQMTPVRQNILRLFKRSLDRAYGRHMARCRKFALTNPKLWKGAENFGSHVDRLFTYMAGVPAGVMYSNLSDERMRELFHVMVRVCYTNDRARREFEKDLVADLRKHAAEYELLAQMPPPKREYTRRKPRTLVEKRADEVDEKVREWERKLKLAKTKLLAYKKKQRYYQKKGAVAG